MPMEKTFDAATAEAEISARWEAAGAFVAGANAAEGAEPFCILLPPPNVTGSLHMGHAFNHTLMDILARWRRMQGRDVLWQPGLDHAGIATQMVVERELARKGEPARRELGREAFTAKVWEWKEQSGGSILEQCKRLGDSFDLSRNRFTMDPGFHDAVLKAFVDFYDKGLIFRGKRLVNWDPHFETAISDLEVEQVETKGSLWRLRYALEDGATYEHPVEWDDEGKPTAFETRDYLVVATTRPETMLGDTGVAVHPDDARYAHLVGKTVRLPLVGRSIPIVADEYADPEKGTGAVKITPAHDFNDWEVGKRAGLRVVNVMDTRACISLRDNAEFEEGIDPSDALADFDGMDRYEARDLVITLAEDRGLARRDRRGDAHGSARGPVEGRHRAAADGSVVRGRGDAGEAGDGGGALGRDADPAGAGREDVFPLAGEHRALVHLAAAVVGASDTGLVWASYGCERRPRTERPFRCEPAGWLVH